MSSFKRTVYWLLFIVVFVLIGWFGRILYTLPKNSNSVTQTISLVKPTPLLKYSIGNLSSSSFKPGKVEIGEEIADEPKHTSYKFIYKFSPDFSDNLKSVSGLINIPKGEGTFPLIVMFRGYINQETYVTGQGTQPSAKVFSDNGFITIAPDFLGYGESDTEAENIFESRFQTYVTASSLLTSVSSIEKWDEKNIFIWGHSNGGQIALTTLEIMGVDYPTVLWAPVSRSFPASILYYIDEADDGGRLIIGKLAEFNEIYDAEEFSLTNYLYKIKAPILINQGTADTAVPYWWSDSLVKKLDDLSVDVKYKKYAGADHNMLSSWNEAVNSSILFFESFLR